MDIALFNRKQKRGDEELIPAMPQEKKEYFAGVVDGIALMSESKPEENEAEGA